MSKECNSRDKDHEVGLCSLRKASETPKAEGSYSMISHDSDSSYVHHGPGLCAYHCHAQPTPGWVRVEIIGHLQVI